MQNKWNLRKKWDVEQKAKQRKKLEKDASLELDKRLERAQHQQVGGFQGYPSVPFPWNLPSSMSAQVIDAEQGKSTSNVFKDSNPLNFMYAPPPGVEPEAPKGDAIDKSIAADLGITDPEEDEGVCFDISPCSP